MATVRKRGGKYQVQVRRRVGGKIVTVSASFEKKAHADRWAADKESEVSQGVYHDIRAAQRTLMADLFDRYEQIVLPTKETTSHIPDKARLRTLKHHFPITLAELSANHVLEYVKVRNQKVSSDAIRKELQLLSDVVDSAMLLWELHIVANPVPAAKRIMRKLRMLQPGNKRERRLKPGEYELLRDAPHDKATVINLLILFAIETGLRRGEVANAQREHVSGTVLYVPKSKTDWKVGRKGRVVPLSPLASDILKALPCFIDGSIFGMKPESISQAFERVCESQHIVGLRFHDLRHEAVSRWFEMGFTIEEVAAMSGHKDWRSLKRYTHPDPEKLALRLSQSFPPAVGA